MNMEFNFEARIIRPDGSFEDVTPNNETDFSLEEMQNFVEDYIEIIGANDINYVCVLNENGKLNNLDYNHIATNMCNGVLQLADYIVRTVLICKHNYIR